MKLPNLTVNPYLRMPIKLINLVLLLF